VAEPEVGTLVGERLGKYELLSLLAVGGTAEIYLARIGGEAGFEKFVVIKCLLDHLARESEFVDMFLDEARLGAQLDHSNIVQTLELGKHDGRYFLAMEYLAGMSLAMMYNLAGERLPEGMPLEQSLALCAQACAGLHYAHERTTPSGQALNIIHRDVSPQNLVVSFEGVLKLVDFGIAKAAVRKTKTRTGTIKGKFAYMSPEQCLDKPIDRRTDIFALGTVLHELVTGRRLFKRENTYDTYQAIVSGKVPRPSEVNPLLDKPIDDLVMRALAYQPDERYESAEAFGEAIHQLLHRRGKPVGATATARFIDKTFAAELSLHADRMRELVSDGRASMQDITWNAPANEGETSIRAESEEPLNFDSPPRARPEATPPRDFEDDQPTRLDDPWVADDATIDEPTIDGELSSTSTASAYVHGQPTEVVDDSDATRVEPPETGAIARATSAVESGPLGKARAGSRPIPGRPGSAAPPLGSRSTVDDATVDGKRGSRSSGALPVRQDATEDDDDMSTIERPRDSRRVVREQPQDTRRRRPTVPPPVPALPGPRGAAARPKPPAPATLEPSPAAIPAPAGGVEAPSATSPTASAVARGEPKPAATVSPTKLAADAGAVPTLARAAPPTASVTVPALPTRTGGLRWRVLAVGFAAAAVVGLLATSAVLALF